MNSRVPHSHPDPSLSCVVPGIADRPISRRVLRLGFLCLVPSAAPTSSSSFGRSLCCSRHRAQAQANTLWNIIYVQQNDRKISLPCAFLFLVLGAMSAACVCRVSSSVQPAIFFVVVVVVFFFFCCCELLLQQHSSQPPSWSTSVPLYQVSSLE